MEEKVRGKGLENGVSRREQMKRGRGMKGRDERSRGIEIHIADALIMIKPTTPFRLSKHTGRRQKFFSFSLCPDHEPAHPKLESVSGPPTDLREMCVYYNGENEI